MKWKAERSFAAEGAELSKQGGMGNFKGRWEGVSGEKEIERMQKEKRKVSFPGAREERCEKFPF